MVVKVSLSQSALTSSHECKVSSASQVRCKNNGVCHKAMIKFDKVCFIIYGLVTPVIK